MAIRDRIDDWRIKLLAAKHVIQASRLQPVGRLTLRTMTIEPDRYAGLADGLMKLPVPQEIRLGRKRLPVPMDMDTLCSNITYGQRLYLVQTEAVDAGIILRLLTGYYYPLYTGKPWDEREALLFGRIVLNSLVVESYPVATHLTHLMEQLVGREGKLLQRQPSKQEKAAGIDRLTKFADLTALLFLQDSFKCTPAQVMLMPYDDCLVRFMLAKEQAAYAERLTEVYRRENKPKKGKA